MRPRRHARERSSISFNRRLASAALAAAFLLPSAGAIGSEAPADARGLSALRPKAVDLCRRAYLKIHQLDELDRLKHAERQTSERSPRFLDDRDLLREQKLATTLGSFSTRFSPRFDTRFYFTTSAKPRPDGSIPMVDRDARGLIIYLHGSGTAKASGLTFAQKASALQRLGYSVVSFDLPFHADGSRNLELAKTFNFQEYFRQLVLSLKQPGQPVYLLGHSFGPDLQAEFISRYSGIVDGVGLISPAGWDKVTNHWQTEKTDAMFDSIGDVVNNDAGGLWASLVTRGNTWNNLRNPLRVDPTLARPETKVHVVSGSREEYVPGPLNEKGLPNEEPRDYDVAKFFKRAFKGPNVDVRIEPGVGHYIFFHADERGQDVIQRTAVGLDGFDLARDGQALRDEVSARSRIQTPIDSLASRYATEPYLRDWLDRVAAEESPGQNGQAMIARMLKEDDKKGATQAARNFTLIYKQRLDAMNANIRATAEWAPAFYAENAAEIEKLGTRGYTPSKLYENYAQLLETQDGATRAARAVAGEDVYKLPVREIPTGPRPDAPTRGKKTKR